MTLHSSIAFESVTFVTTLLASSALSGSSDARALRWKSIASVVIVADRRKGLEQIHSGWRRWIVWTILTICQPTSRCSTVACEGHLVLICPLLSFLLSCERLGCRTQSRGARSLCARLKTYRSSQGSSGGSEWSRQGTNPNFIEIRSLCSALHSIHF